MAKLGFNYGGDVEELNSNDFDRKPLPDGEYDATITDADYRETKLGTGYYVSVEYLITGGEYADRKVWANYNLVNSSPKAQEIGEQQFAKLCLATLGKPSCGDTDELIGCSLVIGVGLEKNDPTRNRVKYTSALKTIAAPARAALAASPAAAAPRKNAWQK
jgi:hypothetical protein